MDSAPDLAGTLFELLAELGVRAPAYEACRAHVSQGVRGLLGCALGITPEDSDYEALRARFLQIYATRLAQESELFPGVREVLEQLDEWTLPWAVATNKPARFTSPLLAELDLMPPSGIVLTPDDVEKGKPDPAMVKLALAQLGVAAETCWFIGDAHQDMIAGNQAGVVTAIAGWGYIGDQEPLEDWQADLQFSDLDELLARISAAR